MSILKMSVQQVTEYPRALPGANKLYEQLKTRLPTLALDSDPVYPLDSDPVYRARLSYAHSGNLPLTEIIVANILFRWKIELSLDYLLLRFGHICPILRHEDR